jgi:hypothetical protein
MGALSRAFPLQDVTTAELKTLCRILWNWDLCDTCQSASNHKEQCRTVSCQWGQRSERLEPFFDFYRDLTGSYVPDFFGNEDQALRGHQDLFDIILLLKQDGTILSRDECRHAYFVDRGIKQEVAVPQSDQDRAFNLASRVMTMVKFNHPEDRHAISPADGDEHGLKFPSPCVWPPERSLQAALVNIFPMRAHPSLQSGDAHSKAIKVGLKAVNLKRVAGLRIEGTDDLTNHLRLDQATGVVQVFHHTSVLKEHLLASKPEQVAHGVIW